MACADRWRIEKELSRSASQRPASTGQLRRLVGVAPPEPPPIKEGHDRTSFERGDSPGQGVSSVASQTDVQIEKETGKGQPHTNERLANDDALTFASDLETASQLEVGPGQGPEQGATGH